MRGTSITQDGKGAPGGMSITFDNIEANIDLEADRFSMPEKEEADEEPAAEKGK